MKRQYGNASQVKCHVNSYADGGKVKKKVKPKPKQTDQSKKVDPSMLGTGAAAKAGEALKNKRQQQMDELGLKDGGMVPPKKGRKPKSEYDKAKEKGYGPGGPKTPGAKGTYPKRMKCGGKVKR